MVLCSEHNTQFAKDKAEDEAEADIDKGSHGMAFIKEVDVFEGKGGKGGEAATKACS